MVKYLGVTFKSRGFAVSDHTAPQANFSPLEFPWWGRLEVTPEHTAYP